MEMRVGRSQMRRVFKSMLALHIHFQLQAIVFSYTHFTTVTEKKPAESKLEHLPTI